MNKRYAALENEIIITNTTTFPKNNLNLLPPCKILKQFKYDGKYRSYPSDQADERGGRMQQHQGGNQLALQGKQKPEIG